MAAKRKEAAEEQKLASKTVSAQKRKAPSRSSAAVGGADVFDGLHPWTKQDDRARSAKSINTPFCPLLHLFICLPACLWNCFHSGRQKKIKEQQKNKVLSGQSFEGRTWKSEAEMVMRQGYD